MDGKAVSKSYPKHDPKAAKFYMQTLYDGKFGMDPQLSVKQKYDLLAPLAAFCETMGDPVFFNYTV